MTTSVWCFRLERHAYAVVSDVSEKKDAEPGRTSGVDAYVVGLEVSVSDVLAVQMPKRKGKLRRAHPALETVSKQEEARTRWDGGRERGGVQQLFNPQRTQRSGFLNVSFPYLPRAKNSSRVTHTRKNGSLSKINVESGGYKTVSKG